MVMTEQPLAESSSSAVAHNYCDSALNACLCMCEGWSEWASVEANGLASLGCQVSGPLALTFPVLVECDIQGWDAAQ